ncbi:proteoglycan 4 isoform X2 [Peromyscus leucopus]|uniref:proteoglycan 4 isoform X2 n=1 Tax=Peromyscus leucopus TaxID=10041 RepID=UPI001885409F|nr:proteoglycan 4 isoform X2 [Peromyscus leucopus]
MRWKILPICLSLLLPALLIQQASSQELSCKGRCFESFSRGRECDCDAQCKEFGKCCADYASFCEEVKDNKKNTPKKEPNPEAPVVDEAGSGLDNAESKLTPTPDNPTPSSPKTTAAKPASAKPSLAPNPETSKEASSTSNKETTVETKESSATNKQTSASKKEKTTSAKEIRSAEKKDAAPTADSPPPTTAKNSAPTTTKKPVPTTTKEPVPTTTKKPVTTTKEPAPTTPKKPEPTTPKKPEPTTPKEPEPTTPKEPEPTPPKEPEPTTPKEPEPTTPKEPEPTTPKEPEPTTPKEPEPTTPKEPAPTTPKEPEPTTPKKPEPTTPKEPEPTTPKESEPTTPKKPEPTTPKESEPTTPKKPEPTTPKEPAPIPTKEPEPTTTKKPEPTIPEELTPEVSEPEPTTAAKEKTTEKDTPKTTTVALKTKAITPEETTKSEASTTTQITPTTQETTSPQKTTVKATTLVPKVPALTEETLNKPEEPTPAPEDSDDPKISPKPQKPTKAPKKPTPTKKPKAPKKPTPTKKPKGRKPKTTPPPLKTTPAMPEANTTPLDVVLPTTASPKQTPNSEAAEVTLDREDAEGGKHVMIPRPPVLSPIVIPGSDHVASALNHGMNINSMLSDETNLCNGKPVDGLTTLRNGTLVAFRGHYFWLLNPFRPPSPPRRITEVWGIPSPIDTVFTRCNCEGKTFFFKDSQYWRFTNDVQDAGYPKPIVKGFGGLTGKVVAALSIAKYKDRPESVYFFKRGGNIQQYTYKHEPVRKCTAKRPTINYSVYGGAAQVRKRRFERAVGPLQTHTFRIHYSVPMRVAYQDKGFLHNEVKVSTLWRGFPNVVTSAITLPNARKPDGYDYYAFSKDQYYNIDVPTRTARAITTRSGQTLSKVWYNCP